MRHSRQPSLLAKNKNPIQFDYASLIHRRQSMEFSSGQSHSFRDSFRSAQLAGPIAEKHSSYLASLDALITSEEKTRDKE